MVKDELPSSRETPRSVCDQCGRSFVPLDVVHVQRQCEDCGQTIHMVEPGERGQGIHVRPGDQVVIPAGAIRLSLDHNRSRGVFFRHGITWFVEQLFFSPRPQSAQDLPKLCVELETQYDSFLEASPLLQGFDLQSESDQNRAFELLSSQRNTAEWFAVIAGSFLSVAREAIDQGDALTAAWAMKLSSDAHAMFVYLQNLESLVWSGYNQRTATLLQRVLQLWNENRENDQEEFWQSTFSEHAFVLAQALSIPVFVLKDKAYVGGKGIDNSRGHIVDYLLANQLTGNTVLIEIKTPKTKLLGQKYRNQVYAPSPELTGAVTQVEKYKHSLITNFHTLRSSSNIQFHALNQQCIVVAGNYKETIASEGQSESFEIYRQGLRNVQLITYDELFAKIDALIKLLERTG